MNKRNRGITLVALVITIIVLLILAGVSIALVVGDNGVLSRSQEAKAGSIVAEEKEQVNLAYSSALTKNLGDAVTVENLQDELDESVGSGKTTVSENGNNLNVLFNETGHSYNVNKGRITGGDNTAGLTDLEKLQIYFGKGPEEIWDNENDNFKDMEPIPDASTSINLLDGFFIQYNNNYYLINIIDGEYTEQYEVSLLDFGVHNIDGMNILVTPSTPDNPIHDSYEERTVVSDAYYLKSNGDLDLTNPYTGNVYITRENLYDKTTGEVLSNIELTSGLQSFRSLFYAVDNRPFTEGYYGWTKHYYDVFGVIVDVYNDNN